MEVIFRNVTIMISADSAQDAYDQLFEVLNDKITAEFAVDTYSTRKSPDHPESESRSAAETLKVMDMREDCSECGGAGEYGGGDDDCATDCVTCSGTGAALPDWARPLTGKTCS